MDPPWRDSTRRGGAETIRDGAGVPAALRVPDARCGRRRVRLRVRGGPGDASRRVPAMWARGGPTASVWQEAASAPSGRRCGASTRARGATSTEPAGSGARRAGESCNDEPGERRRGGQGAWQASLPALWRVKRAQRLGVSSPRSASPECGYRQALTNLLGRIAVNGHGTSWSRSHSRRRAGSRCGPPEPLRGSRGASPGRRCPWARPGRDFFIAGLGVSGSLSSARISFLASGTLARCHANFTMARTWASVE